MNSYTIYFTSSYIDKTGRVIIPLKYDNAYAFKLGFEDSTLGSKPSDATQYIPLAPVTLSEKDFYISKDGTEFYDS